MIEVEQFSLGKVTLGIREIVIKDVILYSDEITWRGRVCIVVKLFFMGKGILTEKMIKNLLETHPRHEEIFKKYFYLKAVFKIQTKASEAYKILGLSEECDSDTIDRRCDEMVNDFRNRMYKVKLSKVLAENFEILIRNITSAHDMLIKNDKAPLV